MTEIQYEKCLQCLNRKRGISEKKDICNIKGKNLNFEGSCDTFDQDRKVISGTENKIQAIKPNEKRAKYAQILIGIVLLLEVFSIASSYLQLNLLKSLQNGDEISENMLNANDNREQIIGLLYTLIFIISAVTFIQWFRRAYFNLNIRTNCEHSEGWASGSWFVPIISLYRPFQIMKELWTKTSKLIQSEKSDYKIKSTSIIGVWWTLWILSNYIGKYALKKAFKAETIEDFINSTWADLSISIIGIPLAILAILIIREYSKKEEIINELENRKTFANKV